MPVLASTADIITRKLPKLFSPRAHRAADYAMGASFALAGAWFWPRNRQAALAAWICGGSIVSLALLTSYPDRRKRLCGFPSHAKLEVAIAALVATMPELFDIHDDRAKRYFRTKAGILTLISNLTAFTSSERQN